MSGIVVACLLFSLGLYGVLTRREIVAVLASIEVMLGGATLLLVVLSSTYGTGAGTAAGANTAASGQAVALLLLAVVAAEAAVGLAVLVSLVRHGKTGVDDIQRVRG